MTDMPVEQIPEQSNDEPVDLLKVDPIKLHMCKNEELRRIAQAMNMELGSTFVRQEVLPVMKARLIDTQRDGLVRKVIFHNVGEGAPSEVTISLNGTLRSWPRDMPVDVPTNFLKILDDAVEWRTEVINGQRVRRKYMTHTYSFADV